MPIGFNYNAFTELPGLVHGAQELTINESVRGLKYIQGAKVNYNEKDLAADPKGWPASVNELSFLERVFGV